MVEKNNLDNNTPFNLNIPLQGVKTSDGVSKGNKSDGKEGKAKADEASLKLRIREENANGDATPLGKLMEQYHRLAQSESKNVQERMEAVKPDKIPFTTADGTCAQYPAYWQTAGANWWEANVANWQALGYNATSDNYAAYMTNPLNILQAAGVPAAAAATSSTLNQRLPRISPNTLSAGGGKYSRGNCECPNCMETERIGLNNMPVKKRGVHNCHIRGCGKVYNKSSHLKAHLRWHSAERSQKPRRTGEVA